jgi:hypothetical protein
MSKGQRKYDYTEAPNAQCLMPNAQYLKAINGLHNLINLPLLHHGTQW